MCGVAGILGRLSPPTIDAARRMSAAMTHRGPDGEGLWTSEPDRDGLGCVLVHRRLAIIDLSEASLQPMVDDRTGSAVAFNGEIYNFRDLRRELQVAGGTFRSNGDTEVLLRALVAQGVTAVPRLRGMFAFAFWDGRSRLLRLVRDPFGIKPLYYCRNPDLAGDWTLVFASELRAVLASGLVSGPRLNPTALSSFVWNGFVAGPHTIVQGISLLGPSELLECDATASDLRPRRFKPDRCGDAADGGSEEFGRALSESVAAHLVSDVPLAVFLSSGVDSTAVANLARLASRSPVRTFTLGFDDAGSDESHRAERIAAALGTEHQTVRLAESEFLENLEPALESLDQPTFDGVNSYFMSRAVREAGLKVAIVGTGGDELLGGYRSFRDLPRLHRMSSDSRWVPEQVRVGAANIVRSLRSGRGGRTGRVGPQTRWAKLPDMVRAGTDLVRLYQLSYAMFLPSFQDQLVEDPSAGGTVRDGLPSELHEELRQDIQGRSTLQAISRLETRCFLGERLLRDSDAASMAVSLELRVPLVDTRLCHAADRLSDANRYEPVGQKALLRRWGHAGLDPSLLDRPKAGFVMPFDRWIRSGLSETVGATLRDGALLRAVGLSPRPVESLWHDFLGGLPGLYWSRVWGLYVLTRWCHRHSVLL